MIDPAIEARIGDLDAREIGWSLLLPDGRTLILLRADTGEDPLPPPGAALA